MKSLFVATYLVLFLASLGCSTTPDREKPAWISEPTRVVDNGYVVYVGSGEEVSSNDAELAGEGMAIQDLANECSFIPKGTRVEDRYSEKQKNTYKAYAKVAVELQVCDEASKTTDPEAVKNLASAPFTEELKKFEDSIQDGRDEVVDSGIGSEQLAAPAQGGGGISGDVHFFMARQFVVYQNQAVILAPPGTYAPGTPAYIAYNANVRPVIGHVQTYAAANPTVKTNPSPWSSMAGQVRAERPQSFKNPNWSPRQIRPPQGPRGMGRPGQGTKPGAMPMGRGRRRGGPQNGGQYP